VTTATIDVLDVTDAGEPQRNNSVWTTVAPAMISTALLLGGTGTITTTESNLTPAFYGTGWFDEVISPASSATPAVRVDDLKHRSGLTWEQLGKLFGVSRRAVHHWVNGGNLTAANLARLDVLSERFSRRTGPPADVRAWLFSVDESGSTPFAAWVRELTQRKPSDGRGLAEQLIYNVDGEHISGKLAGAEATGIELREL
jgi:hypothetical protein